MFGTEAGLKLKKIPSDSTKPGDKSRKGYKMEEKTTVSIVISTKNEEASVGKIIESAKPYADEIIVSDGHSTDRTREIAEKLGVRAILDNGKGKGDAIRCAIPEAKGEIIVFLDADGSGNVEDIPDLVAPIARDEADMVIGSRSRGGSDELHGDLGKLIRVLGSDIILIGINWRFKADLTDSQSGFRAIRTSVAKALGLVEDITTIEQEMTMKCLKQGYRVSEIPSHEFARMHGESRILLRRVWFRYVWSFIKYLF